MQISIDATVDQDGDFSTGDDQKTVKLRIPIDYQTNSGGIRRNTCYRISATIGTLSDEGITASISAADWETVNDQNSEVGE